MTRIIVTVQKVSSLLLLLEDGVGLGTATDTVVTVGTATATSAAVGMRLVDSWLPAGCAAFAALTALTKALGFKARALASILFAAAMLLGTSVTKVAVTARRAADDVHVIPG